MEEEKEPPDDASAADPTAEPESVDAGSVSFVSHGREAAQRYQRVQRLYSDYAYALGSILEAALGQANIRVHTLEQRAKELSSFQRKASSASEQDPSQPKYPDPLTGITDLAGARVIAFFLNDLTPIRAAIRSQFQVIEEIDKTQELEDEGRFVGYQSHHYVVQLKPSRVALPEYSRFAALVGEIQVRTILQHAWAEIEHDMQYKSVSTLPAAIRGRFAQLAGAIAIADREFQAIQEDEARVRAEATRSIQAGDLERVEITASALKEYLDARLGPDGRMKEWAYDWNARLLIRLGFSNLRELDELLNGLDDDALSRQVWGGRQGQLTRFEDMLICLLGGKYIQAVPYQAGRAKRMIEKGVTVPGFTPEENAIETEADGDESGFPDEPSF